ncbi:hypothetical protein Xmau_00154 [Xenorhabdus mauleonii]|uniref:Uncharacterized protein n=1 Tax=Xenorhabdus mauleonii TaxID=351675 RepID=A0A1I3N6K8_9GAMM|nr:hypothetical protein Xmau_00154 [Xenorhabdus mauleonii]SFJ04911.1 hypothetical protein SAMN05421680_105106 [Xenorhabdus mauleonii]
MYDLTSQAAWIHGTLFIIGMAIIIYSLRFIKAVQGKKYLEFIGVVVMVIGVGLVFIAAIYALWLVFIYVLCLLICHNSPLWALFS